MFNKLQLGTASLLVLASFSLVSIPVSAHNSNVVCQRYQIRAEYFNNTEFKGKPKIVRCEELSPTPSNVLFDIKAKDLKLKGINEENFSVRYSGIVGLMAGNYNVNLNTKSRLSLYIDGNLIAKARTNQPSVTPITLIEADYFVRVDWVAKSKNAFALISI